MTSPATMRWSGSTGCRKRWRASRACSAIWRGKGAGFRAPPRALRRAAMISPIIRVRCARRRAILAPCRAASFPKSARSTATAPRRCGGCCASGGCASNYFPADLFADPAWDMLLDLYAARLERQPVSVSSLCIAAAVPATTALRWIKTMTDAGLFVREADPHDGRRIFIALAEGACDALARYFEALEE